MLKQDITYEDLEGNKITETFYFHLNKAEAIQVQAMFFGASQQRFEEAIKKQDLVVPINAILDVILMAYGEKSADNRTFVKTDENRQWFKNTNAYGELVELLSTDEGRLMTFLKGIMPAGYLEEAAKVQDKPAIPAQQGFNIPPYNPQGS
jgi:hypothetical protein